MNSLTFHFINNLTQEKATICFSKDKLLVVSEAMIMLQLDLENLNVEATKDLVAECSAVSYNPETDSVTLGYKSGEVVSYFSTDLKNDKTLATFTMAVRKLALAESGKVLLCASEDSVPKIVYLNEVPEVVEGKAGHEGSLKSCAVHPTSEYFATTGCDGHLNIYSAKMELVHRIKILEDKKSMMLDSSQQLEVAWSTDGKELLISGDLILRIMETEKWEMHNISEVNHGASISILCVLDKDTIAVGSLDKTIKIWNYHNGVCLYSNELKDQLKEITFKNQHLAILTETWSVGIVSITEDMLKIPSIKEQLDVNMEPAEEEKMDIAKDLIDIQTKINFEPEADQDLRKKKPVQEMCQEVIGGFPQSSFQINETDYIANTRFLCWNSIGSIISKMEHTSSLLMIEFADKSFHRNLSIIDRYNISLVRNNI